MKSALFVDFDNVFSLLRQLQPSAAEQFARHPDIWIRWLTESFPLPEPQGDAPHRRLLVRRCYLNPTWYQSYRHAFLRAGFEIVDCPPVTSQGKTSTDIHLVLDAVDLLQHETRYDEFIVFSADADFTPLLRKLRRHDRRTTVLAIGFPSAAYQASADLLIPERLFVSEALYGPRELEGAAAAAPNGAEQKPPIQTQDDRVPAEPGSSGPASATQVPQVQRSPRPATPIELAEIANRIWQAVEESPAGVSSGLLASRLKGDYSEALEDWNGCGAFKAFFFSLNLARLAWASGHGGRVIDPARHEPDGRAVHEEPDSPWAGESALFKVIKEVCSLTKAPMLSPKQIREVLQALSTELSEAGYQPSTTAAQVCSRCLSSAGMRVRQRDVTFLIRGMQFNGHTFGEGHDDVEMLGTRLVEQVLFLCTREQMLLDDATVAGVRGWITGVPIAAVPLVQSAAPESAT